MLFASLLSSFAVPACAAEAPIACNPGALTSAERQKYEALTRKIFAAVMDRSDTADGYAFRLDRSRVSLAGLGEWIELEERCCPFLDFRLDLGHDNGPLTLALGGRKGVREFIASELAREKRSPSAKATP